MKNAATKAGVLALQGGFAEHQKILTELGVPNLQVRTKADLEQVDRLIIPGGESTVISKFLTDFGLRNVLIERKMPIFGTCAGAIIVSNQLELDRKVEPLKLIDMQIKRNAYGTQLNSFTTTLLWQGEEIEVMLIRAPQIMAVGDNVEVLIEEDDNPLLVRNQQVLAATFHPELVGERAIHRYFMEAF